jgi:lipoate-protein ligase A
MLWRNDPSVIIGKHQNAFAEINHEFINQNGIHVVRRISGGGAVYHDHGNLNFTITGKGDQNSLVDFHKYTLPIINAINKLGVTVVIGNRNSLYINGLKISGNAEHVYKQKVIHHGTILFNSNLENLNKAISPSQIHYDDKSVKSIRSNVTNLSHHLPENMGMEDFANYIISEILIGNSSAYNYTLTESDKIEINRLKEEKYITWDWNFGYSPPFSFKTKFNLDGTTQLVIVKVKNGIIEDILPERLLETAASDTQSALKPLITSLLGSQLRESSIVEKLSGDFPASTVNKVIRALFIGEKAEHLMNLNV